MIHMISAWAAENELILGQIKTKEKSNEITAIPELLSLLSADYLLAVKENQGTFYECYVQNISAGLNLAVSKYDL